MNKEQVIAIAKPILFNTEMVQAILEGRKTQTRRVVKPQPMDCTCEDCEKRDEIYFNARSGYIRCRNCNSAIYNGKGKFCIAPYNLGDILYVRESWQYVYEKEYEHGKGKDIRNMIKNFDAIPKKEMGLSRFECPMAEPARMKYCVYKASNIEYAIDDTLRWRPSIHMPKEAARLFLQVTDIRVERLQECGKGWCIDIEKEGVVTPLDPILYIDDDEYHNTLREQFKQLWDGTIKKADYDKYGWDANPWVWVVEFERIEVDE